MAFCDLSHTFHKQVTNVSHHVFVILLWGILMSPLGPNKYFLYVICQCTINSLTFLCQIQVIYIYIHLR